MDIHPLKDISVNELHNRPFPVVALPAQISSLVFLHSGDRQAELDKLAELARLYDVPAPSDSDSTDCYYQSFNTFDLRWEFHNEFSTYTVIRRGDAQQPLGENMFSLLDQDWVARLGGQLIAANHIDLRSVAMAPTSPEELSEHFDGQRLVGGEIYEGCATIWTSVQAQDDGFIRTLVIDKGMDSAQAGRVIRNLLEIAAYRSMTLLALPIARQLMPEVRLLEQRLVETNNKLNDLVTLDDEQNLMDELISEATQLEKLVADHNFRFSATEAYFNLTESRLDMLREKKIPAIRTLKQFHARRFIPAFNTCMSVVKRKENLSKRISRTSELLHLRLQLSLEAQNQKLLSSMDKRSELQLRLQQTVEGLSVVAMTYYSMKLIELLIKPIPLESYLPISKGLALALLTPVIFCGAMWVIVRIRKKLHN
ncbi:DUF3422 domain-containing protein [SAR92 clade bacterium H921]|jgi:uncharacterized membrane-anchored protein|nr:DUF3422 domain-containing protein [SAR92 clade bacterium H921]MDG0972167.1 DUF3422 domain-containing protein [Porticoccaceae bacterium]MDG1307460.1 DUF3422 domain-containing protein [Porticoccaceae bacterium]